MLREMTETDRVSVILGGVTHEFGPDRVTVRVEETTTRGGEKVRYASVTIALDDEFPEDVTAHLARVAETG